MQHPPSFWTSWHLLSLTHPSKRHTHAHLLPLSFDLLPPPTHAFWYSQMVQAMASATGIAFTICFSLVCSLGLLGLFNLR